MPSVIHVPDLRNGYIAVADYVTKNGVATSPRGQFTWECLDTIIVLEDPTDALPVGIGRKLNTAIGIVEAVQLIAGHADAELTARVAPSMVQFMDGPIFHGAYGRRIARQMDAVELKLRQDRDSRQAVVTLWDPMHDNVSGKKDYPCTVMLQFMIRQDKLVMHTTMRSNDVWWGLTYDAFQFTQLQLCLARALDLEPGPYHHHAVSLHVYERDLEAIGELHPCNDRHNPTPFLGIGHTGDSMLNIRARARIIMAGQELADPTETEERYCRALHPA